MTGFVLVSDSNYLPLASELIRGLMLFSTHPVFILTLGCDYPESSRVVSVRYDGPLDSPHEKSASKLIAIQKCNFDSCVVVDCDVVPNWNCDDLVHLARSFDWWFPIMTKYPDVRDPDHLLMEMFEVKEPTMPYGQAGLMLISASSKRFLLKHDEILWRSVRTPDLNGCLRYEEYPMNALLWKWRAKSQMSYAMPRFDSFHTYVTGSHEDMRDVYRHTPLSWNFFHGQKDSKLASIMIDEISGMGRSFVYSDQERRKLPFVMTYPSS